MTVPAAAIYELSALLMMAPTATDPELTARGYRRVFRATSPTWTSAARWRSSPSSRGFKRVAIYYIRNAYGRGLANAFEERAGERDVVVVARQSYDPSEQVTERTFERDAQRNGGTWSSTRSSLAGEVPSAGLFIAAGAGAGHPRADLRRRRA